jgi:hypothetical protein
MWSTIDVRRATIEVDWRRRYTSVVRRKNSTDVEEVLLLARVAGETMPSSIENGARAPAAGCAPTFEWRAESRWRCSIRPTQPQSGHSLSPRLRQVTSEHKSRSKPVSTDSHPASMPHVTPTSGQQLRPTIHRRVPLTARLDGATRGLKPQYKFARRVRELRLAHKLQARDAAHGKSSIAAKIRPTS